MTTNVNKPTTRIEQIMTDVKHKIASVSYVSGTRLPSIRAAAKVHNVSASTVAEAYERCGIVFLDKSRGNNRNWCSMKTCGNRAKVARFADKNN
ncbi:CGNR zinc finger domain-containing protein [Psychrobacter lutiphocae]|uniref:CGNR zinc finger domain-containing protein n=1 Tax=Psychrobacter lutiphocae TaxID=540500 RepID=UPI00036AF4B4|nr:CGNR zinc finger domain-containing protein [Psychrobacter lutiphocae]